MDNGRMPNNMNTGPQGPDWVSPSVENAPRPNIMPTGEQSGVVFNVNPNSPVIPAMPPGVAPEMLPEEQVEELEEQGANITSAVMATGGATDLGELKRHIGQNHKEAIRVIEKIVESEGDDTAMLANDVARFRAMEMSGNKNVNDDLAMSTVVGDTSGRIMPVDFNRSNNTELGKAV